MACSVIIAEFNPLSNGHKYIINKTKELFPADKLVVIMSGNFVQRGEPAIVNKFERAKVAVSLGVDAVIELPTPFAISSAEDFAFGAIKLASAIKGVKRIVFGSECGDIKKLNSFATTLENDSTNQAIKQHLALGNSYASSVRLALGKDSVISQPNNLLGVEYIKAINKQHSPLEPISIKREFDYNDASIHSYASASAIREAVFSGNHKALQGCLPEQMLDKLINIQTPSLNALFHMLFYKLQTSTPSDLQKINGISEGLEYRILDEINRATNYAELVESLKSKRYPKAKVCRILTNILLSISAKTIAHANECVPFFNVLAVGQDKSILKDLKDSDAKLITKVSEFKLLNDSQLEIFNLTLLADKIYAQLTKSPSSEIYKNKL